MDNPTEDEIYNLIMMAGSSGAILRKALELMTSGELSQLGGLLRILDGERVNVMRTAED